MTATNHALTGATIGLLVGKVWVAVPVALLSHFVCDVIPHYGSSKEDNIAIKSKEFKRLLIVDASLCLVIVAVLAILHPHHWFLACVCAFAATSPDLLWINRFIKLNTGKKWRQSWYSKFAHDIQWFQRPIGAAVELLWASAAITILAVIIKK